MLSASFEGGTVMHSELTDGQDRRQMKARSGRRFLSTVIIVGTLAAVGLATWFVVAAQQQNSETPETGATQQQVVAPEEDDRDRFRDQRRLMVEKHLGGPGIVDTRTPVKDKRILDVMGKVPRHRFVPKVLEDVAYADHPLPIGESQTISQPYIVALMTELARPKADSVALDVGTGSGYQAAVLAELCKKVYSIEIVESLGKDAKKRLADLGYKNLEVRIGDGYRGWPEHAPFDLIILAAAPDHIPKPLIEQLAPGGRLVLPVGPTFRQNLIVVEKQKDGKTRQWNVAPVAFVPMTGEARDGKRPK